MPIQTNIKTIAAQVETKIYTFNCQVVIEQENDGSEDDDVITIAPENIDLLIAALQQAKRQLLAESL